MLLFNQYRPEVVLIRNWATGWELRVSVSWEEACNLLRPEYTHWNSGTPDCDHDVNSSKQNNKVGCSTYVGKRAHCKEPVNLYSPPPPFLHEMDGLSCKEKDTLLCASRALTPQIGHISLTACWVLKLFLQSDGTGPKKASVDARLFSERQHQGTTHSLQSSLTSCSK